MLRKERITWKEFKNIFIDIILFSFDNSVNEQLNLRRYM